MTLAKALGLFLTLYAVASAETNFNQAPVVSLEFEQPDGTVAKKLGNTGISQVLVQPNGVFQVTLDDGMEYRFSYQMQEAAILSQNPLWQEGSPGWCAFVQKDGKKEQACRFGKGETLDKMLSLDRALTIKDQLIQGYMYGPFGFITTPIVFLIDTKGTVLGFVTLGSSNIPTTISPQSPNRHKEPSVGSFSIQVFRQKQALSTLIPAIKANKDYLLRDEANLSGHYFFANYDPRPFPENLEKELRAPVRDIPSTNLASSVRGVRHLLTLDFHSNSKAQGYYIYTSAEVSWVNSNHFIPPAQTPTPLRLTNQNSWVTNLAQSMQNGKLVFVPFVPKNPDTGSSSEKN